MKQRIFFLIFLTTAAPLFSSDMPAYRLFKSDGTPIPYRDMTSALAAHDIVLFGEMHGNPVAHWLELEIAGDLFAACKVRGRGFIMGGEMFETDTQLVINEYLEGHISPGSFEQESRPWPNYDRDYRALLENAGREKIPFIATNAPKRYASMVFRKGLESLNALSEDAKKYIAPLPLQYDPSLKTYRDIQDRIPSSHITVHSSGRLAEAQALRDATMAHFILVNLAPGRLFFHINGSYHSRDGEGIAWHIRKRKGGLKIGSIATVSQKNISHLLDEHKGIADYILAVPASMPGAR